MKPINEQINADFVKQAQKLSQYKHLLSGILPIECRNHVEVANFRNQNLMLITDSPVWTTRLRQLSPQLLDFIRKNTQEADELHSIHTSRSALDITHLLTVLRNLQPTKNIHYYQ